MSIVSQIALWDHDNEEYSIFQNSILSYSSNNSLDHALLSDADFLRIHPGINRPQLLNDPGPLPAMPNNPTQAQLAVHNQEYKEHLEIRTEYRDERDKIAKFKSMLENSLPKHVLRDDVSEVGYGTGRRSLQQIYAILNLKFATMSTLKLIANQARLNKPFNSVTDKMDVFIAKHVVAHHIQQTFGGGEFPENIKITSFLNCFSLLPEFSGVTDAFLRQFPTVAQQTFANLTVAFQAFADTHSLKSTAATEGYVAAATTSITIDQYKIEELIAAAVTSALKKADSDKKKTTTNSFKYYCWSHGPSTTHNGINCNRPAEGHIPTATLKNPQGGKTTPAGKRP